MDQDRKAPESKLHENLRYIGYTVPIVGGAILLGLLYLFLEPIIAFLWSIVWILAAVCAVCSLLGAVIYLVFFRKKG